ncbi:RNA polymerase sigma factor [Dorea sp. OM07-5]|uniref:RNA polymerase sigma factor n=1 Tax=Dorea sp. OM07-5 TaxID=2293100 RepID=UPI000E4688BE|nr:RNA polymerase sigma factor [Dorea sp. OM07-5]
MNKYLLEQLYKRYYRELYLYIYSLSSNCTVTDDILQDTFLKAWLSLKDSHTNMRAWLYMVARNLYYNYYKKAKTLASLEAIHTEDAAPVSEYFIKKDVLEEILQKEGTKQLWEAIHHLKGQQKEVILLQYFGDFSQREIAAMLRLTTGSVKMLAYRAKKELKKYLISYRREQDDLS